MVADSTNFESPFLIQPTTNATANISLSAPVGPINCDRYDTSVRFYNYTPPIAPKAPWSVFADAGERATRRAVQDYTWDSQVPNRRFTYEYGTGVVFEFDAHELRSLTFKNVFAAFECLDVAYISSWEGFSGVGGATFELRQSGFEEPVIAIGHIGGA